MNSPVSAATPGQTSSGFFAQIQGQESGPHTLADLQQLARDKSLKIDTPIRQAAGNWYPAGDLPGLFSSKSYVTALLLSVLVGVLGIDRFYLGYTGLGVAKLLTLGGCGIWQIVDVVLIAMRKLPDSDGLPLGK